MIHKMNLQPQPFEMIKSGIKTIELRLNDEKRQKIKVGDSIIFTKVTDAEPLQVTVVALHPFPNFAELYAMLPLEQCGYLPEELAGASYRDMDIYYTPAEQAQHGVLGIEISLSDY